MVTGYGMMKTWWWVYVVMIVLSNMHEYYCINVEAAEKLPVPQVPCFFIFGDSLADSGNNNLLLTLARVNYRPYGIDYPNGPTGRFTNGRTTVDIIAELLGFDHHIPPFTTASASQILRGVNYASGSAGILRETGKHMGDCISFGKQMKHHRITVSRISDIVGDRRSAKKQLGKCLYWVELGNNDYINNYFTPQHYPSSRLYTPDQYADLLIQKYSQNILSLYKNGARKIALIGLGQIGCTPNAISTYDPKGSSSTACVDSMNNAVPFFNYKLQSLVHNLNSNLTDAQFVYVDSYSTNSYAALSSQNPTSHGFEVLNVGCCPINEIGHCMPSKTPCENRTSNYFWDSFHPTEAANLLTASSIYNTYLTHLLLQQYYSAAM